MNEAGIRSEPAHTLQMYIAHLLPGFKGAQSASGSSKTGGGSEAPDPPRVEVQRAAV